MAHLQRRYVTAAPCMCAVRADDVTRAECGDGFWIRQSLHLGLLLLLLLLLLLFFLLYPLQVSQSSTCS